MKLRFLRGGRNSKEILEFKVTFILRRLHETGPRDARETGELLRIGFTGEVCFQFASER